MIDSHLHKWKVKEISYDPRLYISGRVLVQRGSEFHPKYYKTISQTRHFGAKDVYFYSYFLAQMLKMHGVELFQLLKGSL